VSYWDAAYIAKFYLDEPESGRVRALAEEDGHVSCSRFGYVETISVFHRKMREGVFGPKDLKEISLQLDADSQAGLWSWLPVSPAVLDLAGSTYRHLPKGVALRAGDALHLASARVNEIENVYSNDVRLLSAARYFDVSASNPAVA
jgi:predicted nucleic acid-binding protein